MWKHLSQFKIVPNLEQPWGGSVGHKYVNNKPKVIINEEKKVL